MALDLSLVPHAAERKAVELSVQGLGNGLADGCLADPGRAHKTDNRTGYIPLHLPGTDKFQYPVFYVIKPVVVPVEYLFRLGDIVIIFRIDAPGQGSHPLKIIPAHAVFCGMGLQEPHLLNLFINLKGRLFC